MGFLEGVTTGGEAGDNVHVNFYRRVATERPAAKAIMSDTKKPSHLRLVGANPERLTGKQEAFAQAVAKGAVLSDAYREAYDAERMKDKTIWEEACKLAQNPKVSARVKTLQAQMEEDRRTREARREEFVLKRLQEEAMQADTDGARVRALELLGKTVGLFSDRVEIEQAGERSAAEIEAELQARLSRLLGQG
jgi:hypothetical protein